MITNARLIVCHRNRLIRDCLALALSGHNHLEVVAVEHPNSEELAGFRDGGRDLLLIDAGLPDMAALQLVQTFRTADPSPRTILLISSSSPDVINLCLSAGADGCVLDDDTLEDLRHAIDNVFSGRSYCSPQVAHRLFTETGKSSQSGRLPVQSRHCGLTRRQLDILRMIAQRDLSNKQIARELRISIYTVKNHVHSIIEKLSVEDRQTAARHAVRHGLVSDSVLGG
jgi:DNA-binding NarL/FixJ family response regulator